MSTMASQITSLTIVYWIVYSGADQRKYQSSASLALGAGTTVTGVFPAQRASNAENAITRTNADSMAIRSSEKNFNEIWKKMQNFLSGKCNEKPRPFCSGPNKISLYRSIPIISSKSVYKFLRYAAKRHTLPLPTKTLKSQMVIRNTTILTIAPCITPDLSRKCHRNLCVRFPQLSTSKRTGRQSDKSILCHC